MISLHPSLPLSPSPPTGRSLLASSVASSGSVRVKPPPVHEALDDADYVSVDSADTNDEHSAMEAAPKVDLAASSRRATPLKSPTALQQATIHEDALVGAACVWTPEPAPCPARVLCFCSSASGASLDLSWMLE